MTNSMLLRGAVFTQCTATTCTSESTAYERREQEIHVPGKVCKEVRLAKVMQSDVNQTEMKSELNLSAISSHLLNRTFVRVTTMDLDRTANMNWLIPFLLSLTTSADAFLYKWLGAQSPIPFYGAIHEKKQTSQECVPCIRPRLPKSPIL